MRIAKISDKDRLDRSSVGVMGTSSSVECTVARVWVGADPAGRGKPALSVIGPPARHGDSRRALRPALSLRGTKPSIGRRTKTWIAAARCASQ
jgi:hypothetical protein